MQPYGKQKTREMNWCRFAYLCACKWFCKGDAKPSKKTSRQDAKKEIKKELSND